MPRYEKKKRVFQPAKRLYALVADVGRYPEFLPLCRSVSVYERTPSGFKAELCVGRSALQGRFTSRVALAPPHAITMQGLEEDERLERLCGAWRFDPVGEGACDVSFFVDFRFRSPSLEALALAAFPVLFEQIMRSFEKRAAD